MKIKVVTSIKKGVCDSNIIIRRKMKKYINNMSKKNIVLLNLRKLYDSYGYKKISLPNFEEYDLYNENKDFILGNILTIMNPSGNLLALRPDITLSVAKKISKEKTLKYDKVYYQENIYTTSKYIGYSEKEQLGVELIGKETLFLNFEIVSLALKSLEIMSKKNMLVLSHAGFISSIFENLELEYEIKEKIFEYINNKNVHEIKIILKNNKNISDELKNLIYELPNLSGNIEEIEKKLSKYELNPKIIKILSGLKDLYNLIIKFHSRKKIIFDFSIIKNLKYYNGIIMQGFIDKIPNAVLSGGRYDKLFEKFGVDTGAIGFAVVTDNLNEFYKNENQKDFDILLLYDESDFGKLAEIVDKLVKDGNRVRTQNIIYKNYDFEIFNYDKKYIFENGELKIEI